MRTPIRVMLVDGEADDGPEGVGLAGILKPDVVVMDVRMPNGGGVEACRELRDHHPEVRVIMLTSYSDDEALFNSIMAGAAAYVLKEIRGHDPVQATRNVAP